MDTRFEDNTEHTDETFRRVTYLHEVVTRNTFEQCSFANCSLQETVFQNCKFIDCTFKDCNLRLMRVPGSSFRNTTFEKSNVSGVNWTEGMWPKTGLLESIGFTECDISYATFIGLALKKMVLTKCTAKNADFAEADLTKADCSYTDFVESRFLHTTLTEADFTHAFNYAIDVSMNVITKAKFTLPEAIALLRSLNIILVE